MNFFSKISFLMMLTLCAKPALLSMNILSAAKKGNVEELAQLLLTSARDDVNMQNSDGRTPLHLAVQYGHVEMVRKLIEAHAKVDLRDRNGETPLHLAIKCSQAEIIELLVKEAKAGINIKTVYSPKTPLFLAVLKGEKETAKLLINAGARVNDWSVNRLGSLTPLHQAAHAGNIEIVRLLLSAHADVRGADTCSMTPLDMARQSKHQEIVDLLESYPVSDKGCLIS